MKTRNFFFAALAAAFAFASCEQADPNGGGETTDSDQVIPSDPDTSENPTGNTFEAGDYWIISGEKVAIPVTGTAWWSVENAVDGKGYTDNAFTFVAVEGGYNIKDAEGNYYYVGDYNGGASQKITAAETLPEGCGQWSVEEQEDGTYKITDLKYNAWLQFTSYGNFGVYTEAKDGAVLPVLVSAQDATDRPEVESPYKSALEWTPNDNNKSYTQKANVNGVGEVDVLKLGTGSIVGTATLIVPVGTTKISFWGVAWNGQQGEATFSWGESSVTKTFVTNTGAAGNAPYAISIADTDKYEIDFGSALTEDTTVTISTVEGKYRVILGGFIAE